jgi:hypothetical protein
MAQPTLTVKDAFSANILINTINPNGQATAANSGPVVIASDQSKIPVTLQNASAVAIGSLGTGTGVEGLLVAAGATEFFFSTANSSTAQLAAAATFTGAIESIINAQAISLLVTSDQTGTLTLKQYIDLAGTRISSSVPYVVTAGVPFSRCFTANGNYFSLTFVNNGGSTTTTLNINTAFGTLPAVTSLGNLPISISEINGVAAAVSAAGSLSTTTEVAAASGSITTQNLVPAGVATAGSAVEVTMAGGSTAAIQVTGTYTGALSLQATLDGTNWITLGGTPLINLNTSGYLASITSALQSVFQCEAAGALKMRVTGLAAMTGTAVVTIRVIQGAAAMVALDNALPAGTAIIGALVGNQSTNIAQLNGGTIATSNGTVSANTARIAIASDNTANSNPWLDTLVPSAAQGSSSTHHLISAASTNATSVKGSAGTVGVLQCSNINAAVRYLKLYNKATAPTVGTDTPVMTIAIPPNSNISLDCGPYGMRFSTGIAYALTTGITVADTGAVAVSEHSVSMFYT